MTMMVLFHDLPCGRATEPPRPQGAQILLQGQGFRLLRPRPLRGGPRWAGWGYLQQPPTVTGAPAQRGTTPELDRT